MNTNNANTGIASKVDGFSWFKPTSQPHVEGFKTTAPDFSIPPTPASSYSNLHVVLDHVHPSSETITRSVVAPFVSSSTSFTSGQSLPQAPSSTYVGDNALNNNRIDMDILSDDFRAVPIAVDPEQPGARSSAAVDSLKSEVAPMPIMVQLDDFSERSLPESVNISLVDESAALRPTHNFQWDVVGAELMSKNWRRQLKHLKPQDFSRSFKTWSPSQMDRLEEAERQWRMSRPISPIWSGRWHYVGLEITSGVLPLGWAAWFADLKNRAVKDVKDLAEFAYDATEAVKDSLTVPEVVISETKLSYGPFEGAQLIDFTFSRRTPYSIIKLEEEERLWRMSKGINPLLSGKWYQIGRELKAAIGPIGFAQWFVNLKNRTLNKTADVIEEAAVKSSGLIESAKDVINSAEIVAENALETGAFIGAKLARKGSDLVESAVDTAKDAFYVAENALESAAVVGANALGSAAVVGANALGSAAVVGSEMLGSLADSAKAELVHLNATKTPLSAYPTRGMQSAYAMVDFTFKAHRTPAYIIAMEEEERLWRMSRPVSPIILGLYHRLGLELKYKFSLRPTFASAAADAYVLASGLVGRAEEALTDLSGRVVEKGRSLLEQPVVTPRYNYMEHGRVPLNLFAFTAKPIDFTFKSTRTPKYIIELEERERAYRIAKGVDALLLKKWNSILSQPITVVLRPVALRSTVVLPSLAATKDAVIEAVQEKAAGLSGFFGSFAHSIADTTSRVYSAATHSHLVESAKSSLGMYAPGSTMAITKAEEAERLRRINEKVDPMMSARLARVQDELLHTIKSV